MAMNNVEYRRVVCFLQPNFTDILKQKEYSKLFSVKTFDECDTIHVRVEFNDKSFQRKPEKRVVFKVFEVLPPTAEHQQISSSLLSSLPGLDEPQIAILVAEDEHIRAFVRPNRGVDIEEATVIRQVSSFESYFGRYRILPPSVLKDRKVAVVGLGSGGSHIAMELAKSGVGKFVLVDFDRIELQNIIRHVCGLSDLGRLKTNAMRDRILETNPFAEVEIYKTEIDNNMEEARRILKGCDMVIAATDNNKSRFNINTLSLEFDIPAIYGSCAVRAAGGQVARVRPKIGPCFSCIFADAMLENMEEEMTSFRQARKANPSYIGDEEVQASIQVGLSSDIIPIANMMVKLALVELCRGDETVLASLESDLEASFYMWANRREEQYSVYVEDSFHSSDEPAILRWYSMSSDRRPDCKICQDIKGSAKNTALFSP